MFRRLIPRWQQEKFVRNIILVFVITTANKVKGQRCGAVLREFGRIQSAYYPDDYPSNYDCTWTIEANDWDTVRMKFDNFDVEPGETCEFDYLLINWKDGSERFCGKEMSKIGVNGFVQSEGKTVLRMVSDESVTAGGFTMKFEVIRNDPPETTPPPPTTEASITTTTQAPVKEYNSCADEPCEHGGECVDVDEGIYFCFCDDGFEGDRCETNIDDCASNPCINGATCVDGANEWTCNCVPGYVGETCAIDIDECKMRPCKNGGVCIDKVNSFECMCPDGYSGWDCTSEIDECESNPCKNYGVCEDHVGHFTCICHPAYTGPTCEVSLETTTAATTTTTTTMATTTTTIATTTMESTTTMAPTTMESATTTTIPLTTMEFTSTIAPSTNTTSTQQPSEADMTTVSSNEAATTETIPESTTSSPIQSDQISPPPLEEDQEDVDDETSEHNETDDDDDPEEEDLTDLPTTNSTNTSDENTTKSSPSNQPTSGNLTNSLIVDSNSTQYGEEEEEDDLIPIIAAGCVIILGVIFTVLLVIVKKKGLLSGNSDIDHSDESKSQPAPKSTQNYSNETESSSCQEFTILPTEKCELSILSSKDTNDGNETQQRTSYYGTLPLKDEETVIFTRRKDSQTSTRKRKPSKTKKEISEESESAKMREGYIYTDALLHSSITDDVAIPKATLQVSPQFVEIKEVTSSSEPRETMDCGAMLSSSFRVTSTRPRSISSITKVPTDKHGGDDKTTAENLKENLSSK